MNTQNPNFIRSERPTEDSPAQTASFLLLGAALGALTFYFLDPAQGRRRRARLSEQLKHWSQLARRKSHQTLHHWAPLYQRALTRARKVRPPVTDLEVTETVETFISY